MNQHCTSPAAELGRWVDVKQVSFSSLSSPNFPHGTNMHAQQVLAQNLLVATASHLQSGLDISTPLVPDKSTDSGALRVAAKTPHILNPRPPLPRSTFVVFQRRLDLPIKQVSFLSLSSPNFPHRTNMR